MTALTGCIACKVPPISPMDVPADAPSLGGIGDHTVVVRVTEEWGGPAIAHAGVVVFYAEEAYYSDPNQTDPNTFEPSRLYAVSLRTDQDGVATAMVPSGRALFVAAGSPGLTQEWQWFIRPGEAGEITEIDLPLFKLQMTRYINGTWNVAELTPVVVQGNWGGEPELADDPVIWHPQSFNLAANPDDPEHSGFNNAAYHGRIVGFDMTLEWTNTAMAAAEFGIAAGPDPEHVWMFSGSGTAPSLGDQVRTFSMEGAEANQETLFRVGPATDKPFVAAQGIPYTLRIDLDFDYYDLAQGYVECGTLFEGVPVDDMTHAMLPESDEPGTTRGEVNEDSRSTPGLGLVSTLIVGFLVAAIRRNGQ